MKLSLIIGWIFFGLEAILVASFFFAKNDGKAMATSFGIVLLPILLLVGAFLLWAQMSGKEGLQYAALLIVSVPVLVGGGIWATNVVKERTDGWSRDRMGRFQDARLNQVSKALDQKNYAAVEALVKQRPALDWAATNGYGETLVAQAVSQVLTDYSGDASAEGVAILLRNGGPIPNADLVIKIFEGNSPGVLNLLDVALQAGADPNAKDKWGEPLVHFTHAFRAPEKLALLARHGADLKALSSRRDRPKWTALMTAVEMESWEVAVFLLEHGVSADYKAPDGKSVATLLADRAASQKQSDEAFLAFRRELEKAGAYRRE